MNFPYVTHLTIDLPSNGNKRMESSLRTFFSGDIFDQYRRGGWVKLIRLA